MTKTIAFGIKSVLIFSFTFSYIISIGYYAPEFIDIIIQEKYGDISSIIFVLGLCLPPIVIIDYTVKTKFIFGDNDG